MSVRVHEPGCPVWKANCTCTCTDAPPAPERETPDLDALGQDYAMVGHAIRARDARDQLAAEAALDRLLALARRAREYERDYREIAAEPCREDEVHCSCVAPLRSRIEELEEALVDARAVARLIVGWWPGVEDGISPWPPGDDHPILLAARRVLEDSE